MTSAVGRIGIDVVVLIIVRSVCAIVARSQVKCNRSILAICVVVSAGLSSGAAQTADGDRQAPTQLVDVECPYAPEIVSAFGAALECMVLSAPMRHENDEGGAVQLAVARIRSLSDVPSTNPLFMLLGGPGQEVESVLPLFAVEGEQSYRQLRERRDVILVDQRGVGYSEPSLACPFDAVGGVRTPERRLDRADPVPAFAECAAGLRAAGVDLEAFDSIQSAADLDLLRGSLGYDQVDLLGTSYGTRLALTVMRDFPGTVRSAILDSPQPLQANLIAGQIIGFDHALSRLFAECANEESCRSRYPDLETSFAVSVESLDASPLSVPIADPGTGVIESIEVDGSAFTSMVYLSTYLGPLLPFVPALIDGVRTGDYTVLEAIAPYSFGASSGVSLGASYVINCNDELGFASAEKVEAIVADAGVRPQLADGAFAGAYRTFEICAQFAVEPGVTRENEPVSSDVPVLVLGGAFDPITPPTYAEQVLETLPNGTAVTFAGSSHAPLSTSGNCGYGIVSAFLARPGTAIDTSCANSEPIEFLLVP